MKTLKYITGVLTALFISASISFTSNAQADYIVIYQSVQGQQISTEISNGIENIVNSIAPEIRSWIINNGVQFHITDQASFLQIGADNTSVNTETTAFVFVNGSMNVFIQTGHKYGSSVASSVIHEVGHLFDDKTGVSGNSEFQQLVNPIAETLRTWRGSYKLNDYHELWAETFNMYGLDPQRLYNLSPGLYDYCQRVFPTTTNITTTQPASPTVQKETHVTKKVEMPAGMIKDTFDYTKYADTYADVKAAFGYDRDKLWEHYKKYGLSEGREAHITQVSIVKETVIEATPEKPNETQEEEKIAPPEDVIVEDKTDITTEEVIDPDWGAHKKPATDDSKTAYVGWNGRLVGTEEELIKEVLKHRKWHGYEIGEIEVQKISIDEFNQDLFIEQMDALIASHQPKTQNIFIRFWDWLTGLFIKRG